LVEGRAAVWDAHAVLVEEVSSRAEELLSDLAAGRAPGPAWQQFCGYLRDELLTQDDTEMTLLLPLLDAADATALDRDHQRLRALVELLGDANPDNEPAQLAERIGDLVSLLDRHVRVEDTLLAAQAVRLTADMAARFAGLTAHHAATVLLDGPIVDCSLLPAECRAELLIERLRRLKCGELMTLRAAEDPHPVHQRLSVICPGEFAWSYQRQGPPTWLVTVSRRGAD
jgi:uncharacterized protein (DUF2249 family)